MLTSCAETRWRLIFGVVCCLLEWHRVTICCAALNPINVLSFFIAAARSRCFCGSGGNAARVFRVPLCVMTLRKKCVDSVKPLKYLANPVNGESGQPNIFQEFYPGYRQRPPPPAFFLPYRGTLLPVEGQRKI